MATRNKDIVKVDYFEYQISTFVMLPILYAFGTALYAPEWLPWYLGPLRQLATYCATNHLSWTQFFFRESLKGNFVQSLYVGYLCWKNNLKMMCIFKWMLQTVIAGLSCVGAMRAYNKKQQELKEQELKKQEE